MSDKKALNDTLTLYFLLLTLIPATNDYIVLIDRASSK
jgi:hypothetical protein